MIQPEIFNNSDQLHQAAAEHWINLCSAAIVSQGAFHVALSGGTTPKALFKLLASDTYRSRVEWDKVHFYFGDERFVPHTHDDSNYKMAKESMLDHIPCLTDNIHAVNTSLDSAEAAAQNYAETLSSELPKSDQGKEQFDLVLLGLGPDGHTASLFPETSALDELEKSCTAVFVEKFNSWRVSITFPVINAAKEILLLSEGEGKADIVYDLLVKYKNTTTYPVQRIKPMGKMSWFIDKAAAKNLT